MDCFLDWNNCNRIYLIMQQPRRVPSIHSQNNLVDPGFPSQRGIVPNAQAFQSRSIPIREIPKTDDRLLMRQRLEQFVMGRLNLPPRAVTIQQAGLISATINEPQLPQPILFTSITKHPLLGNISSSNSDNRVNKSAVNVPKMQTETIYCVLCE